MKKFIIFFAFFSSFIFVILYKHNLILSEYAKFFTINNAKPNADAIVVLSGSISTRIPHALKLIDKGYAPIILLTDEKFSQILFLQTSKLLVL